jgi:hypothetical protein
MHVRSTSVDLEKSICCFEVLEPLFVRDVRQELTPFWTGELCALPATAKSCASCLQLDSVPDSVSSGRDRGKNRT